MQPAWTIRFDGGRNLIRITLEGHHTEHTIRAILDAASTTSESQPGVNRLWDVRGADLSALDADAIQRLVRHMVSVSLVREVKVAMVTARPLEFGLARMSQAHFADLVTTTTQVFGSLEEAEGWLEEDGD